MQKTAPKVFQVFNSFQSKKKPYNFSLFYYMELFNIKIGCFDD